ncbi:Fatty acid synthase [Armadillidium nasatum]|uniref:Fatty acid synthase n=1 Tax=Armadillidium nasatum TaxID=96803 RepID=A0A5N5TBL5_9CRUS|nr:Fatty acid synthase [Armadillidium nasatum]
MQKMPAYADVINTESEAHASSLAQNDAKASYILKNPNDDVVVSGMSGRFPESSNVREFSRNLFEGIDMITEDDRRWQPEENSNQYLLLEFAVLITSPFRIWIRLYGLPHRSGKIPNLSNFDASFFSVSPRQAHAMDPQLRLLLEVSYEAIFDAGLHPNVLKRKACWCLRRRPSFAMDTACSSAFMAFHTAYRAIADGEIDAAIVAGSNLTLKPQSSLQFHSLSMLSEDGRCKAFDSRANGYVRSEAVTAVFLQKRRDASRIYAEVVFAGANTDGFKGEGITFPSGEVQKELLVEVYQRAGVDPKDVSYVEAHGTGTKAGDPQELNAIADIFCQNRSEPLLIGSVKSNMGHSEPASGSSSHAT